MRLGQRLIKFHVRVGDRFGKLTATGRHQSGKYLRYECICDCGVVTWVISQGLRTGKTKSCGCLKSEWAKDKFRTHGLSRTSVHNRWLAMRRRCECPQVKDYSNYGGRGITVCARWKIFENFLEDMGLPPENTSLERLDNNLGYCKENCVWASVEAQSRNRRNNRRVEYCGSILLASEWDILLGFYRGAVTRRLDMGWTVERALTTPIRKKIK